MIAAMAGFAVEDALLKQASDAVPVGQLMILFGAGGALLFSATAAARGERLFSSDVLSPTMRWRFAFEMGARLFYTLAIVLTPLSSATAILQAAPIVVVMGAALVFGERVGWRRWTAVAIGLTGVLVILRPATDSFSALSLLAVLGMLGFSLRDLASRAAPVSLSSVVLGIYGFAAIAVAGALWSLWEKRAFVWPEPSALAAIGAASAVGAMAYGALMSAMRTGDVSVVAPFRYTRLLFGITLGVVWFGETLDTATAAGCVIVVASGLFIFVRGRARG
ncbi:DMT family transporter [Roseovarius spongiae]|uniref:DMT family transporter n=2 Tax=Roseovarius spongiae TaxID=2320272 RepID=A0A3A8B4S0_9RHOB|nr:DMT family transporter [Roseovarius spongiae]